MTETSEAEIVTRPRYVKANLWRRMIRRGSEVRLRVLMSALEWEMREMRRSRA